MRIHYDLNSEEKLFDALGEVFRADPSAALEISKRAACQIAAFVADVGAVSERGNYLDIARNRIAEMRVELEALDDQLAELAAIRTSETFH